MQLLDFFVRSPVKVSVGVLLLALFGYVSFLRMPMQLTPEVQTPTITIETHWPGASPQEVEREIVLEQEEFLKSVKQLGASHLYFSSNQPPTLRLHGNLVELPVKPVPDKRCRELLLSLLSKKPNYLEWYSRYFNKFSQRIFNILKYISSDLIAQYSHLS